MTSKHFGFNGYVGIGHQTVYETAVARTAFARYLDAPIERSHGEDGTGQSRLRWDEEVALGDYNVEVSAKMEARPETVGSFLKAFAGTGSTTSVQPDAVTNPTVYEHTIVPKDVRAPVTWERRRGTTNKSTLVDGVVFEEFTLEYAKQVLMFGVKGPGRKDTIEETPTTPTFDAKRALLKHEAQVTLGGVVTGVKTIRIGLNHKVDKDDYETGDRYRKDADISDGTAFIECELAYRNSDLLKKSLGGAAATTPQDDPLYNADKLVVTGPLISGAYNHKLELDLPKTHWSAIGEPTPARGALMQRVRGRVLYNEATSYPWQAKLTNTQTTI